MISRVCLAAGLFAGVLAAPSTYAPASAGTFKYSLPSLSGEYCVGKAPAVLLTDNSRKDIFGNDTSAPRQVLVEMYYPTANKHKGQCPGEAYATPGFAQWISGFLKAFVNGNVSADYFSSFQTHSVTNAPYQHDKNAKLLIFSHGLTVPRKLNQALVEDVVSHGYIVAMMEHLWDSDYAETPDGRVIRANPAFTGPFDFTVGHDQSREVEERAADTLFTISSLKSGKVRIPGCDISSLADKVGMFGHSLGGQLSVITMLKTDKIIAGTNMDGWFWNEANATAQVDKSKSDTHRPYLNLRSDPANLATSPINFQILGGGYQNQVDAMKAQSGPKVQPIVKGSMHYSYTDLTALSIPAVDKKVTGEVNSFQGVIGDVDPKRMHKIMTDYHSWFFDNTVKGGKANINKGLSGFPEVTLGDISSD